MVTPKPASYLELPEKGVIGHRQITDACLSVLARKHAGCWTLWTPVWRLFTKAQR